MPDLDELREALRAEEERSAADSASDLAEEVHRRIHLQHARRRRWSLIGAAAAVVVVVSGIVVAVRPSAGPTSPSVSPAPSAISSAPRPPTSISPTSSAANDSSGSAVALSRGTWTTLPPAPIHRRSDAVSAWTGSSMIVWGGREGGLEFRDGASYDPATRSWAVLPTAPLSKRFSPAWAWTGRYLFIWGGYRGGGQNQEIALSDGALYDPVAGTWISLPSVDIANVVPFYGLTDGRGSASAVWTGHDVVLATGAGAAVRFRSFDVDLLRWTRLPGLTVRVEIPAGSASPEVHQIDLAARDSSVAAFVRWVGVSTFDPGFGPSGGGTELFSNVDGGQWRFEDWYPSARSVGTPPLWVGSRVLIPNTYCFCGSRSVNSPLSVDLSGHTVAELPGLPGASGGAAWTGRALVQAGPGSARLEALDVDGANWVALPDPPSRLPDRPLMVWTGHSILVWGVTNVALELDAG